MKKNKTQKNPPNYDNFHLNSIYYTPPLFTKHHKMDITKCISPSTSKQMAVTCNASNPNKWTLGSLLNALPFTPSPVSTNADHGSDSRSKSTSSSSSAHDCDFISRASLEFFTPTHHLASIISSTSFRKQEQSPKRKSISTIYESTIDHQGYMVQEKRRQENVSDSDTYSPKRLVPLANPYDHELFTSTTEINDRRFSYPLLPSGSKEKTRRWSENHVRKSLEVSRDEYIRAMKAQLQIGEEQKEKGKVAVEEEEEHSTHYVRPIPYQDFLDEVQMHKRKAELDALYKAGYTDLLNRLKKKEADIDSWELSQRRKAEFKLDRIERKLDKKKAKATQKMHQKVAEAKMEAERRKYKERESVMKKVAKLCRKSQGYRPTTSILSFRWPSGRSQHTPTARIPIPKS